MWEPGLLPLYNSIKMLQLHTYSRNFTFRHIRPVLNWNLKKYLYVHEHSRIIYISQKGNKYPSIDRENQKMRYMYTIEY